MILLLPSHSLKGETATFFLCSAVKQSGLRHFAIPNQRAKTWAGMLVIN